MNRISREMMLLEVAHIAAKRGTCRRLAVGAVIARDSRPISWGYVGAPPGQPHCWEANCDMAKPCTRTRHAERNAIDFAITNGIDTSGCDMFSTDSPCPDCAERIVNAKIRAFYFERRYRVPAGLAVLTKSNVEVYQLQSDFIRTQLNGS